VSLISARFPKRFSVKPSAVFFADWLKEGTTTAYDRLIGELQQTADDPLIYELQVAVRRAHVAATLMACQACIAHIESESVSVTDKLKNKIFKDEELAWLTAVASDFDSQLREKTLASFNKPNYEELLEIFSVPSGGFS